ncbi:hypothetical protein J7K18_00690 [bacterium]|nr:hypothetical protein [bacterium]
MPNKKARLKEKARSNPNPEIGKKDGASLKYIERAVTKPRGTNLGVLRTSNRNVILKYSKPGDPVLDYFCGASTTAVEAKLLGRRCIAHDINDKPLEPAKKDADFNMGSQQPNPFGKEIHPQILVGDARDLSSLQDNPMYLICTCPHPGLTINVRFPMKQYEPVIKIMEENGIGKTAFATIHRTVR